MMMLKKYGLSVLFTLFLLLFGGVGVSAAEVVIFDEKGALSEGEYALCQERLQEAADATGMNIGVILAKPSRSEYSIENIADQTYDELFGKKTDGLLYYMDLSGYEPYDYISTSGLGQFYYTNSPQHDRINPMFDAICYYLYPVGSEDVYSALFQLASEVEYYYDAGIPFQYYVYDEEYEQYMHVNSDGEIVMTTYKPFIDWVNVIVYGGGGFLIGLLIALFVFIGVKLRYRFKTSLSPTTYVNRKNIVYHEQYDHFIRTYTTKVKIESSSGGGGGGSRGGGRSRGGHGGGGRRR